MAAMLTPAASAHVDLVLSTLRKDHDFNFNLNVGFCLA
jgi:hypothetical protein